MLKGLGPLSAFRHSGGVAARWGFRHAWVNLLDFAVFVNDGLVRWHLVDCWRVGLTAFQLYFADLGKVDVQRFADMVHSGLNFGFQHVLGNLLARLFLDLFQVKPNLRRTTAFGRTITSYRRRPVWLVDKRIFHIDPVLLYLHYFELALTVFNWTSSALGWLVHFRNCVEVLLLQFVQVPFFL
jgi:hypothetical protein